MALIRLKRRVVACSPALSSCLCGGCPCSPTALPSVPAHDRVVAPVALPSHDGLVAPVALPSHDGLVAPVALPPVPAHDRVVAPVALPSSSCP